MGDVKVALGAIEAGASALERPWQARVNGEGEGRRKRRASVEKRVRLPHVVILVQKRQRASGVDAVDVLAALESCEHCR